MFEGKLNERLNVCSDVCSCQNCVNCEKEKKEYFTVALQKEIGRGNKYQHFYYWECVYEGGKGEQSKK